MYSSRETIAAVATAPGRGGIGVVRVSGPKATDIGRAITGLTLTPRMATFCQFKNSQGQALDEGLALLFLAPRSYTGEDVLELQGHGGNAVLGRVLACCLGLGARIAKPGEFTERAFLSGKLDLAQAEAVADLIDAQSQAAAASAVRSLTGEFSRAVHDLTAGVTHLRLHIEACIDFPEEEIEPATLAYQLALRDKLEIDLKRLLVRAKEGQALRDGLQVALIGEPNVGKSSLFNQLAGDEVAIVTPIAGTTRDQLRSSVLVNGLPIHLIDTAGLRDNAEVVEQIGIERTLKTSEKVDLVLVVVDAVERLEQQQVLSRVAALGFKSSVPVIVVHNKTDLLPLPHPVNTAFDVWLSAQTGQGVLQLQNRLLTHAGLVSTEGLFSARERHVQSLAASLTHLISAGCQANAYELFAEDLRLVQLHLGEIIGVVTADDLLGLIFSTFCIGK